jgi:hypothetical protein
LLDGAGRLSNLNGHLAKCRAAGSNADEKAHNDEWNESGESHVNHTPVLIRPVRMPEICLHGHPQTVQRDT